MPAKWLGRTDTPRLAADCGRRLLDYNADQFPESPWEPGIRAILHLHPNFDFTKLDILTDRRQLACLLELAFRKGEKIKKTYDGDDRSESFRFGAQVLGSTVVSVRTDVATIPDVDRFRGFADAFKNRYLQYSEEMKDSKSHHRMITSQLGDLRVMLRFHAEGYLPDDTVTLNEALASKPSVDAAQQSYDNITVKSAGALISRSAILELNTCNKYQDSSLCLAAKARECWLSQDAHFVTTKYNVTQQSKKKARNGGHLTDLRGVFDENDIGFRNVIDDTSEWAGENGEVIQEFHELLLDLVERIRSAAAAGQGDKFLVEYGGEGMDISVSPSGTVGAMSEKLCERIKVGVADGI